MDYWEWVWSVRLFEEREIKEKITSLKKELGDLSSHLAAMLDGAFAPLSDSENPMRYSQAAHSLRELLREILSHFAPDAEIKKSCWFTPNPSSTSGVTRKHRTTFAVYGYVNPAKLPKSLSEEVENIANDIAEHVKSLSEYTHTTADVLAKPEHTAMSLFDSTLDLFSSLLSAISSGKETLLDDLQMTLTTHLDDIFINDFFDELDTLSSHTRPTETNDIEISISEIDPEKIQFSGTGSISCELQYGSDGDCRRGDGLEWNDSFPFSFSGSACVSDLSTEVERESVIVDTSQYYK